MSQIRPVAPAIDLVTQWTQYYTDSTTQAAAPTFGADDTALTLRVAIKNLSQATPTYTELLPAYNSRLMSFSINTQEDELSVLEMSFIDQDGAIEVLSYLEVGYILSAAIDYNDGTNNKRYNIGVFKISEIEKNEDILTICAENLVSVLANYTVKGTELASGAQLMAALNTYLANNNIPHSVASDTALVTDGAVTLPDIDVWQFCQYIISYQKYKIVGSPAKEIHITRDGKITASAYTEITWTINRNQIIDEGIVQGPRYNYTLTPYGPYGDYNAVYHDYRYGAEDARILVYDNPLNLNPGSAGSSSIEPCLPLENVNEIKFIDIIPQLPIFYKIGDLISIEPASGTTYANGKIVGIQYDYEGGLYARISYISNGLLTPEDYGLQLIEDSDRLGEYATPVNNIVGTESTARASADTAEATARAAADTAEATARATADNLRVLKAGDTITGKLFLTRTSDISVATSSNGALSIGKTAGVHIEMDGNEIIGKATGTTAGTLYIQTDGGNINIGSANGEVNLQGGTTTVPTISDTNDSSTKAVNSAWHKKAHCHIKSTFSANQSLDSVWTPKQLTISGDIDTDSTGGLTRSGNTITVVNGGIYLINMSLHVENSGVDKSMQGYITTTNSDILLDFRLTGYAWEQTASSNTVVKISANTTLAFYLNGESTDPYTGEVSKANSFVDITRLA